PADRHAPGCSCAPFPWPRRRHQPLRWYLPALHRWHKSETAADVYHRSERRIAWLQPDAGQPVAVPVNAAATARQCAVAPSANGWPASLFSLERLGYRLAILFQQQLYTLLGTAERLLTLTGQFDALFKGLERFFQRRLAAFHALYQLLQF